MAAAFALGATPEDIGARVEDIFVNRKALRRWTWPRYGLIDHKVFDAALAEHYTDAAIEDLWLPYFAASTNLSRNELHLHRRGKIWEAIRASGGIPGLLPPFFNDRGDILVDGALIDNVPLNAMRGLKDGPNVVISFEAPRLEQLNVPYASLPSRKELLMHLLSPVHRKALPRAPGPRTILMRSIAAGRRNFEAQIDGRDLLLMPPVPQGMGALDWHLHEEIARIGYEYGKAELARFRASRHPVMSALGKSR
jgi:NTE family protein